MLIAKPKNWSLAFDFQCRVCGAELTVDFTGTELTSQFLCGCGATNTVVLDGLPMLDVKVTVEA